MLQISANLIRNTNRGVLRAEAEVIQRGRTTLVVEAKVRDEPGKLIASLRVTQLVSVPVA